MPKLYGRFPGRHIFFRERHFVVVIEVAAERRNPRKAPSHAALERLNLRRACSRDHCKRRIALLQVHSRSVKVVCQERAARAALLPSRAEHEVIHHQLAASFEQLRQRNLPRRPFENVALLHLLPRELATLALSSSRSRVNSFSFFSRAFLAVTHSAGETTLVFNFSVIAVLIAYFSSASMFWFLSWREMPSPPEHPTRRSKPRRLRSKGLPPNMPDTLPLPTASSLPPLASAFKHVRPAARHTLSGDRPELLRTPCDETGSASLRRLRSSGTARST